MTFSLKALISLAPTLLLTLISISAAHAGNPEPWFLMARHGECTDIKVLKRKIPEMDKTNDPQSFLKLMQQKGYKVEVVEQLAGQMVQINVPEKELSLIFVIKSMCEKFIRK